MNELSFTSRETNGMLAPILSTLATVKAAKKIRDDIVVAGNVTLSAVTLGDGTHSLGEFLRGNDHRDEWRFLRSLDQTSPWDAFPGSTRPGLLQEVKFEGKAGFGMLWARENDSFILSFAFAGTWDASHIEAEFREMDENGNAEEIAFTEVQIPNLAKPEHVATHGDLINNYGRTLSPSSLVYDGNGFTVRMYVNDHNPPHFHVLGPDSETLARCAIENLDFLSGKLSSALRPRVTEWARSKKNELMECWSRCRAGEHPYCIED